MHKLNQQKIKVDLSMLFTKVSHRLLGIFVKISKFFMPMLGQRWGVGGYLLSTSPLKSQVILSAHDVLEPQSSEHSPENNSSSDSLICAYQRNHLLILIH